MEMSRVAVLSVAPRLAQSVALMLLLMAPGNAQVPVSLDDRRLAGIEARMHQGELHLPLLALAQALSQRVSLNRHAGTAVMKGREFPIVMLADVAYLPQSQIYPLLGVEVTLQSGRLDLYTADYERPPESAWRGTGEKAPLEVRRFDAQIEGERLVVRARVGPARRFSSASGRVRVLLRQADGSPYATFVSAPQNLAEDQEAELVVGTWLSSGVSVNPDRSLSVKDYEFRGIPPTTRLLTVEASAEP